MPDGKTSKYRKRREALRNLQETEGFREDWKDIQRFILPRRGKFDENERSHKKRKDQTADILDKTATRAVRKSAAGLMSNLSSPERPWFALTTEDPDLADFPTVREWMQFVQLRMERMLQQSNFYHVIPAIYETYLAFGTAAMGPSFDFDSVVRYQNFPIGTFYIASNQRQEIDVLYRDTTMSVRQILARFGEENASDNVKNLNRKGEMDKLIQVHHCIEPNTDRDQESPLARDMPFKSVWFEKGEEDKLLRDSGFETFPAMVPRSWTDGSESDYGWAPAMDILPEVKSLQLEMRDKMRGIQEGADPHLLVDDSILGDVLPGGRTRVASLGQATPVRRAIEQGTFDLNPLREDIGELRQTIREGLFEDVFEMLAALDDRDRTAFEIAERREEKLLQLGRIVGSVTQELLEPVVDDLFDRGIEAELFPPPPEELSDQPLRVEFVSTLAQAQRAAGITNTERLLSLAGTAIAPLAPESLDKLNFDEITEDAAEKLGTNPKYIRDDEEVAAIREQRAQQLAIAQGLEQGQQGADIGRTLSETETADGNALELLQGGAS